MLGSRTENDTRSDGMCVCVCGGARTPLLRDWQRARSGTMQKPHEHIIRHVMCNIICDETFAMARRRRRASRSHISVQCALLLDCVARAWFCFTHTRTVSYIFQSIVRRLLACESGVVRRTKTILNGMARAVPWLVCVWYVRGQMLARYVVVVVFSLWFKSGEDKRIHNTNPGRVQRTGAQSLINSPQLFTEICVYQWTL